MKPIRLALASVLFLASPLLAAPANDDFANATPYSGAVQTANNATATVQPGEPSHNAGTGAAPTHSVWWKYTPQYTGFYTIDTKTSTFDTLLDVYTGSSFATLTRVGYDDDSGGSSTSQAKVLLTKGVAYHIAVDVFSGASGTVNLHVALTRYFPACTYQAFVETADRLVDGSGMVTFSVVNTGAVTGKFVLGPHTYSFTAALDEAGSFAASVLRPGQLPVSISATLGFSAFTLSDGVPAICASGGASCTVKVGSNSVSPVAQVVAPGDPALAPYFPATALYSAANPCPRAGLYHFSMMAPTGSGYAVGSMTVSPAGVCTGSGHLGEGTAFTFSAPILDNLGQGLTGIGTRGSFVFHIPLYASKGRFSGTVSFDATMSPVAVGGTGEWLRPQPAPGTAFIPYGINTSLPIFGSRYAPPAAGNRLDSAFDPAGALTLQAYSSAYPFVSQSTTLSTANTFTYAAPNANLVKLTLNVPTATVSGSLKFTGAPAVAPVTAVLIHCPGFVTGFYGYIPGTTGYGSLTIKP